MGSCGSKRGEGCLTPTARPSKGTRRGRRRQTRVDPIVVPNVAEDASLAPHLAAIRAEHIAAMAFIPLEGTERVIGKFMLYYSEPHALSPEELQLASAHRGAGGLRGRADPGASGGEAESEASGCDLRSTPRTWAPGTGTWRRSRCAGPTTSNGFTGCHRARSTAPFRATQREIHPDDRDRVFASIQRALSEGVPHDVEYRIVGPDGTVRWVEGKGRVEYGRTGSRAE